MIAMLRIVVAVVALQLLGWSHVTDALAGAGGSIAKLATALSVSSGDRNGLNPH